MKIFTFENKKLPEKKHIFTIMTIDTLILINPQKKRVVFFEYHEFSGFKYMNEKGKILKKPPQWAIDYSVGWLNTVCENPKFLWDNLKIPLTFKKQNMEINIPISREWKQQNLF